MAKESKQDDLPEETKTPLKSSPLDEVREDAKFNYLKGLRDEEERKAYEEAKASGTLNQLSENAVEEIQAKRASRTKSSKSRVKQGPKEGSK